MKDATCMHWQHAVIFTEGKMVGITLDVINVYVRSTRTKEVSAPLIKLLIQHCASDVDTTFMRSKGYSAGYFVAYVLSFLHLS